MLRLVRAAKTSSLVVLVVLVALVASALAAIVGCGAPAPRPGEQVVLMPKWTLEIRGRPIAVVTLPAHLEDKLVERSGARAAEYTLHASVGVPREMRGRDLTLAIPMLASRARMIVDDHRIYALDAQTLGGYREAGPQRFRIPGERSDTDALDLEIVIDNAWSASAWIDSVPRLSATLDGDQAFNVVRIVNRVSASMGFAATVMLAFAYAALFLADRKRFAHGWQCVQAAATAVYPAFMLGFTQSVFGTRDLAVAATMLSVAVFANVRYMHVQFGLGKARFAWAIALPITVVVAIVAGGPFQVTRTVVPLILPQLLAATIFNCVLFVRAMRARPRAITIALSTFGWPVALVVAGGDMGWFLGLGELTGGFHLASAGMTAIAVLQATALMRDHVMSLRRADDLNVELVARVRAVEASNVEMQSLNDELRRQIAARSRELAESLGRMPDVAAPLLTLAPGDLVEDRYRVVGELGAGGMGAVYLVERVKDARRFALKVHQAGGTATSLARLAREAQLASQIDHPNTVTIVDVDVSQSGVLYIVMEHVDGPSLADLRDRFGDVQWALPLLRQIAEGLAAIHAASIVHRDLKPGNVFVAGGVAKIADFGISAHTEGTLDVAGPLDATVDVATTPSAGAPESSLTATGAIMGTPLYMAPEAARGARNAQPASDVFSFGVIAFEMLAGKLPFDAAAVVARLRGRSSPPPPSVAGTRAEIDPALAELVDRCLSADPAARPTASAIARALRERGDVAPDRAIASELR